jgi:RNA polymerase sigma-70 factor (ECF subfamily)
MTDRELILEYQESGASQHFEALLARHIGKVRGMIYATVLDHHDTDDLAQEVFLRVARHLHKFDGRAAFSTWLHRITMNAVYDFLRRRQRSPIEHWETLPDPGTSHGAPDAAARGSEDTAHIHAAMQALPPTLRTAITLTSIHGMRPGEAAKAVNCLPATMYWRLHEARRRLKSALKEVMA